MIETLDGGDPVWVDGRENIIPSTGFGGFERYWVHDGTNEPKAPVQSIFKAADAAGPLILEGNNFINGAYDWRWRAQWVIPAIAAHIGVQYKYNGATRTLDYGSPPDNKNQCNSTIAGCCILPIKFTNNRHDRINNSIFFPHCVTSWKATTQSVQVCFEGQPRNWGSCCRYMFNGHKPYSNSNGGIRKSMEDCRPGHVPPGIWLFFAMGWPNQDFEANNNICDGYFSNRD